MSGAISFRDQSKNRTLTVRDAGRLGGLAVLHKYGRSHFVQIGGEGQKTMRCRYPNMASIWGRRGGRPRKS
jgi:hypothetical protein